MYKIQLIIAVLFFVTTPVHAVRTAPFIDIKTLVEGSHEIVIAKCVSVSTNTSRSVENRIDLAGMCIVKCLKGGKELGPFTLGTIYPLTEGKMYLLFNSGGSGYGTDFISVAELSVVEMPRNCSLDLLIDKTLMEQVAIIFTSRQKELDQIIRGLKHERALFGKALGIARAELAPPSADQVAAWASFSKPVNLIAEEIYSGSFAEMGEPISLCAYRSESQTLFTYIIGIYKAGTLTLNGRTRDDMQKCIVEQVAHLKTFDHNLSKYVRIETRPDGRKVYFNISGFGIGGVGFEGFTTIGQYDVLLQQIEDAEEDKTEAQRLKNPAKPMKALQTVFSQLEQYIVNAK